MPKRGKTYDEWRLQALNQVDRHKAREILAGIDEIDWRGLEHAYGSAEDIPDKLLALLSTDSDASEALFQVLGETILHQGTLYSATIATIPFLQRKLHYDETPSARYFTLSFLWAAAECAVPSSWQDQDDRIGEADANQQVLCNALFCTLINHKTLYTRIAEEDEDEVVRDAAKHLIDTLRSKTDADEP